MKVIIEKVEMVSGSDAGKGWHQSMQKIITSQGTYIDNQPGFKGQFWRAPDYSMMRGEEVEFTPVDDDNIDEAPAGDRGYYQWIRLKQFD